MEAGHRKRMSALDEVENLGAKLGRGSRASVKLVRHKQSNNELALKTIDLTGEEEFMKVADPILNECEVHKQLCHPNIVR